jgi:hypothetical protein
MKIFKVLISVLFISAISLSQAQTKGVIYKTASTSLGKSVLDPNGDGFISSDNRGFTGTQDWGTESELQLIALPSLEGEPHSDLTTGSNGGHTDLVANGANSAQSSYVGIKNVNGTDYFVVRIRIGGASTATKGYSILIDTDGAFSAGLLSSMNPGYDKEIVLETGNSGRVAVYNHTAGGSTLHNSYNLNEYHQRSVAASTINSDADYFYDFFVPLSGIGISTSQMIRMTAATVTSAQSGIAGTISDFNGIDDKKYSNDRTALMLALVNTFPSASLDQMSSSSFTFDSPKTPAPVVNSGILTTSSSISGTSVEANGTTIYIYKNTVQIGTTTVSSNAWTLTGVSGLVLADQITAKALASGKSLSDLSNTIAVLGAQPCYLAPPVVTTRDNGSRRLSGTGVANSTLTIYEISSNGTINVAVTDNNVGTNPTTVSALSAWGPIGRLGANQTGFTNATYLAKVSANGCTSDYSLVNIGANGITITAPQVMTTTVYQSATSTSISIKNNHASAANLLFYVNGQLQSTQSNIASGASTNFSYAGFREGDSIYARAIGTATNSVLSGYSNKVVVTASATQTTAPTITGSYIAGSGKTVSGSSLEAAGTTITLYKAGTTLLGSTTVTAFGTWSLASLTLTASDVLTAYAKATSKTLSAVSNSVSVVSSAPSAPTVTGTYTVGNTSINGSGGNGTVTVYVGGAPVGTVNGASGNWTLNGLSATELFRGAIIHATNTASGIESSISNQATVTGVASFVITDENDAPLTQKISGDNFRIKVKAKDGNNGAGNDFTGFGQAVTLTSSLRVHSDNVSSQSFNSGVLNGTNNTVTLLGKGSAIKLIVVNPNDPAAFGETTVDIVPAEWMGQTSGDPVNIKAHNQSSNWTHNRVPATGASIKFATNAVQDLTLQADYTWGDVDFNGNDKHIVLGNYNLSVESFTNRSSNVVKTTGSGKLKLTVPAGETVTFPVANASNNFMLLTNNAVLDEVYSVRVLNSMMAQGTTGSEVSGSRIGRVWDLHKESANEATNINIEFRFNNGEVIDYTANARFKMYHYTNNQWVIEKALPNDSTTNSVRFNNYTGTFSPFGVGDGVGNPLPVELSSFGSICNQDYTTVTWTTLSEFNSNYFQLEVSRDGLSWITLAEITEAAHNSNMESNYSTTIDKGYNYARLLQVDYDGAINTYGPINISCELTNEVLIYPNPTSQEGYIQIQAEQSELAIIQIQNSLGNEVINQTFELNKGNNTKWLNFENLPSGIYLVKISINGKDLVKKWIKS